MFYYHGMAHPWNDVIRENDISTLRETGFEGTGFEEYAGLWLSGKIHAVRVIDDYKSSLDIPYVGIRFDFDNITALSPNGYQLGWGFYSPFLYKRSAFFKKIGGYITENSIDDTVRMLYPFVFDNVVYINKPCIIMCMMMDTNGGKLDSATARVIESENIQYNKYIFYTYCKRIYNILGDCRKTIKPIIWQ